MSQATNWSSSKFCEPFPEESFADGAVDVACRAVQIYLTPAERTHPKEAMDQVMAFVDPFKQLSKDFHPAYQALHEAGPQRVPKDRHGHCHWLCHHGIYWLFCQAHTHPHQQHHCGFLRSWKVHSYPLPLVNYCPTMLF
ncbi:hypothetical protein MTO96_008397 [Rhipicephalus appendiculatus]